MVCGSSYVFDSLNVISKLQEKLSVFLLNAQLLDLESTEPVEQVQRLQRRLDSTDAGLHERLQVCLSGHQHTVMTHSSV